MHRVAPLAPTIERMLRIKSDAELELIRESGKWCGVAHRLLQRYSVPGATEAAARLRAGHEATLEMLARRWATVSAASRDRRTARRPATAARSARRSAWAHAVAHNIEFKAGDVLVTETSAPIWGYNAELERAMIIGKPTDEMRRALRPHGRGAGCRVRALRRG